MSAPRLAAVVSHVLGSGGVARDISDSSLATPKDGEPLPLLKSNHHIRGYKKNSCIL